MLYSILQFLGRTLRQARRTVQEWQNVLRLVGYLEVATVAFSLVQQPQCGAMRNAKY